MGPRLRDLAADIAAGAAIATASYCRLARHAGPHGAGPVINPAPPAQRAQRGFTLLELVLVTLILGIVAVAALPNLASSDPARLDVAAIEVANAMRFARAEAMRVGAPRGVRHNVSEKRFYVLRPDMATNPATLIYDVYHPVSKKLYDVDLDSLPFAAVDSVTSSATHHGTCNQNNRIYFDASGTPWCIDPSNVLLEGYAVTLVKGQQTRVVTLRGITGRVTIQ